MYIVAGVACTCGLVLGIYFLKWRRYLSMTQDQRLFADIESLLPNSGLDKRKRQSKYLELQLRRSASVVCNLTEYTLSTILGYNPEDERSAVLHHFLPLREQTHCVFARRANLWVCHPDFIASNVSNTAADMTARAFSLFAAAQHKIDGFLFRIPPATTVEEHGIIVYRLLAWIAYENKTKHE